MGIELLDDDQVRINVRISDKGQTLYSYYLENKDNFEEEFAKLLSIGIYAQRDKQVEGFISKAPEYIEKDLQKLYKRLNGEEFKREKSTDSTDASDKQAIRSLDDILINDFELKRLKKDIYCKFDLKSPVSDMNILPVIIYWRKNVNSIQEVLPKWLELRQNYVGGKPNVVRDNKEKINIIPVIVIDKNYIKDLALKNGSVTYLPEIGTIIAIVDSEKEDFENFRIAYDVAHDTASFLREHSINYDEILRNQICMALFKRLIMDLEIILGTKNKICALKQSSSNQCQELIIRLSEIKRILDFDRAHINNLLEEGTLGIDEFLSFYHGPEDLVYYKGSRK